MPRLAREKSCTGIYHIILRGINQQDIFEDEKDKQRFLETVTRFKKEADFEIYAFCLMNNHVHLLLKENQKEISEIIKKIGTSYVRYFNYKYERSGHLFQDRYKSEAVEKEDYLFTVVRYIHQNPLKARLSSIENYPWSSYKNYIGNPGIVSTEFLLSMFSDKKEDSVKRYIDFMKQMNDDKCLETVSHIKLTDEKVRSHIKEIGHLENISELQKLDRESRNRIIRSVKEIEGVSVSQISRITGLNRIVITVA